MEPPSVDHVADGYIFTWQDPNIEITVDRIYTERHQTHGEIAIMSHLPGLEGHIHRASFNLSSSQARRSLIKLLEDRNIPVDWTHAIEQVCVLTLDLLREGEAVIEVGMDEDEAGAEAFRLWPILPEGEPTILYGDGGVGKSYLACFFSVLVTLPEEAAGFKPIYGRVLYLDYETGPKRINRRIRQLSQGLIGDKLVTIYYQRRFQPLGDSVPELQRIVHKNKINMVVVDSVDKASGGDAEKQEVATRLFMGLRALEVTSLLIGHVTKEQNNPRSGKTPFGSAFWRNNARAAWEVRNSQEADSDTMTVGLYHRKANDGLLLKPIGLKITFSDEEVTVKRTDLKAVPLLLMGLPQSDQILGLLKSGPLSVSELAKNLYTTPNTISVELNRLSKKGLVVNMDRKWGLLYSP